MPRKWKRAKTDAQKRKNLLRPIPHPGEKCSCQRCDSIRETNGNALVALNWPKDYPPKFYEVSPPEAGWMADWEAAETEADLSESVYLGLAETF